MAVFLLECREDEERQADFSSKEASSSILETTASFSDGACSSKLPYNANRSWWKSFVVCMILLFAGKLSWLYSNSKHLIIRQKKFAGKPLRLKANPRKFSTANDLHYTVFNKFIIVNLLIYLVATWYYHFLFLPVILMILLYLAAPFLTAPNYFWLA